VITIGDAFNFKEIYSNLIKAGKDKTIDGIILEVDSFGGSVGAFSVIHDTIKRITLMKPIISLIGGAALSCGYQIASASNYIIAHNASYIGSIGVYTTIEKYKNTKLNAGIKTDLHTEIFKAGKYKAIENPHTKELSDDEKAYVQKGINITYDIFLKTVAINRNINIEESDLWAEGKQFEAPQALKLKLIDEIGTIFEAEEKIFKLIKEKNPNTNFAEEINPIYYPDTEK